MDNDDKVLLWLCVLAIVATLLFAGEPDIADAIREWIMRQ